MQITLPHVNTFISGIILLGVSLNATAAEKFKVCADPLNPPYSSKKQDGFENKIAELFAKDLGQTLEYTWLPQRIGFIRNTLNAPVNDKIVDSKDFKCDVVMGLPTGYDMALTTEPYYQSTYVLLMAKGRGYDEVTQDAAQLTHLPLEKQEKLKIAMFDRGPGTTWLQQSGLLDQGIPYQSMTSDENNNVAMQIDQDLKAKKIDMVILWGPMAGYVISQSPKNTYNVVPMKSSTKLKFDFPMSMGVRKSDKDKKALLDKLINKYQKQIQDIIATYNIPLLPISKSATKDDD
ncbi:quinoprotein dehydrogenase-associated putative ABC transporter substrate-binding protein [Crenothrix polyspora]|uniref:Quinoprotein dehydrogenase-associated ABC transporter substrate-binding protein n=1 Tax=Crenothrix polyspora TaxID=360316 RepID=A0A1R4HJG6_9GAMM|nr:quinoprotein dehydrogenase-associated putative ABC transporter substrate-binding protein [Crenothrix polyspora]SJM96372.1 Quinoprotein dehydrogenase-associated ABC transporter substrate-binding protein [Crenothrix polyspora]